MVYYLIELHLYYASSFRYVDRYVVVESLLDSIFSVISVSYCHVVCL
jgi:hypothetical protein